MIWRPILRLWLHHAALNAGVVIAALFWGALPPHLVHSPADAASLVHGTAVTWFLFGADLGARPTDPRGHA